MLFGDCFCWWRGGEPALLYLMDNVGLVCGRGLWRCLHALCVTVVSRRAGEDCGGVLCAGGVGILRDVVQENE